MAEHSPESGMPETPEDRWTFSLYRSAERTRDAVNTGYDVEEQLHRFRKALGESAPTTLEGIAVAAAASLADASANDVIAWATETFGSRVCVVSSMTEAVVIDLASRLAPGIDVLFMDTGYHFAETIGTRDAVAVVYPVNVINITAPLTAEEQDAELGPKLYSRDPDLCCYLRKIVPLERALEQYDAYITEIRREDGRVRAYRRTVQWDSRREKVQVNPIANWSRQDIDDYVADHGVLENPLKYDGYPVIDCRTCAARVEQPRPSRPLPIGMPSSRIQIDKPR